MKVEKRYYGDGEDSYEMTKFLKPEAESILMKRVVQPLISDFPGAIYPYVEYPEYAAKRKESKETDNTESDKSKKHTKKRKKKR